MPDQLDPSLDELIAQAGGDWGRPIPRSPAFSPQQASELIQPIPRSPALSQQPSDLLKLTNDSPLETRAGRNNNPGALKHGPDAAHYGATGYDEQGFAIFPDWYSGARAHGDLLQRHYRGMTIPQMSRHYSPSGHADWARNVMKIGGYKPHDIPNLDDPVELARLQNAIFREQGRSRGAMPRSRPKGDLGEPTPIPRPRPPQKPEPLPEQPPLPSHGDQPDWYKRMIEHQQRWGYDPASQKNLPDILDKTLTIADILSPLGKLPLGARMGRGLLELARKPKWRLEEADGPSFQKQRSPDKDYGNVDIRRRMEQLQREPAPAPPRDARVKPPRRDYTIEEIGEAMRQIMRERGMEP
jgi:hypothetical protein